MRLVNTSLLLIALTCPALAAWDVRTSTDPLTDRTYTSATVAIPGAELRVQCLNGHVTPLIEFDHRVGVTRVSASYRFDNQPTTSRFLFVTTDMSTVHPWLTDPAAGIAAIRKSHRLRVQIWPVGREAEFYDFDLTGAKEAVAKVGECR